MAKKNQTPPTYEEREVAITRSALNAFNFLTASISDLHAAAEAKYSLAEEMYGEVLALRDKADALDAQALSIEADAEAINNQADKLAALLGN